jgi:hypothetical protein
MASNTADADAFGDFGVPAHTIHKNRREQVRIGLNEYKGTEYIDIRLFFQAEEGWRPTGKGITLKPALYGELLKGVLELGGQLGMVDQETLEAMEREASAPGLRRAGGARPPC